MKSLPFAALALGGMLTLAVGCQKRDVAPAENPGRCGTVVTDSVFVRYAQTQCADPWGQAPSTQQLTTAAQTYLVQQGITLRPGAVTAYRRDPGSACAACTCSTGLVVEAAIVPADLPAVQALGFTRIQ